MFSQSSSHRRAHGAGSPYTDREESQRASDTQPVRATVSSPPATSAPTLAQLDRRSVAIHLTTPAGERVLTGMGSFEVDPELGDVLRVAVTDDVAAYDMLFVADQWSGSIESGAAFDCDYLLRVG